MVDPTAGRDFFISYTGVNRAWAEWIAVQLETAGYSTVLQSFDFRPGSDFVHQMQAATNTAERTVAVLSPAYFASAFSESEWRVAFAKDPSGELELLVPVRVQPCEPPGLLNTPDITGILPISWLTQRLTSCNSMQPSWDTSMVRVTDGSPGALSRCSGWRPWRRSGDATPQLLRTQREPAPRVTRHLLARPRAWETSSLSARPDRNTRFVWPSRLTAPCSLPIQG